MMNQEFKALYKSAENMLNIDSKAQQVLVLRAGNIIYTFSDHDIQSGNVVEELQMAQTLLKNNCTEITELLCMWQGGTLDIPSRFLRDELKKMNPKNDKTKVLLRTVAGYTVKTLEEISETER